MTASRVAANSVEMPTPADTMRAPPCTNAVMPPLPNSLYMASQSPRLANPAVAAMIATRARDPSPDEPRYPTKRASVSLLSCFDVVPEPTRPWKPEIAPHAMVTNSRGKRGGADAGTLGLMAGATMVGFAMSTAPYSSPSPTKSWMPLM